MALLWMEKSTTSLSQVHVNSDLNQTDEKGNEFWNAVIYLMGHYLCLFGRKTKLKLSHNFLQGSINCAKKAMANIVW